MSAGLMSDRELFVFVADAIPAAIEYAERERAALQRARKYHLDRAVERGTCAVGHPFASGGAGVVHHGGPCGYCESAIDHAATEVVG